MNQPILHEEDVFFDSQDHIPDSTLSALFDRLVDGYGYDFIKLEHEAWTEGLLNIHKGGSVDFSADCRVYDGVFASGSFCPSGFGENNAIINQVSPFSEENHGLIQQRLEPERIPVPGTDIGLPSTERLSRMDDSCQGEGTKKLSSKWWRKWSTCKNDVAVKDSTLATMSTKIQHHDRSSKEFTSLYIGQEVKAHEGFIMAMRFNQSGSYLASGGEDCTVRIWRTEEVEASCSPYSGCMNKTGMPDLRRKGRRSTYAVVPEKYFQIKENAVHEFHGHTADILDISWSTSDCLLSASMDKTVRMWKVGRDGCRGVFHHNDYVTCVNVNPADDRYFVSGSLDGKVRVWRIKDKRVVDWIDTRDIVTAVCYRPDGKGLIVGCMTGRCRVYSFTDDGLILDKNLFSASRKNSPRKRITGIQFLPGFSQRFIVTSADSKVRIFDGYSLIHRFGDSSKSKCRSSAATFTTDGKHIVTVGGNSRVYSRSYECGSHCSPQPRGSAVSYPRDIFSSDGASLAVPWPGSGSGGHRAPPSAAAAFMPSSGRLDLNGFSLQGCFGPPERGGSAMWPEEDLPPAPYGGRGEVQLPAAGNLVVVTASEDGVIRSFQHCRLPFGL